MTEHEQQEAPQPGPPSTSPSPLRGEGMDEGMAALQAELAATRDQYLRTYAELENYRKLVMREKADLMKSTQEGVLRALLPVVDSLDRALRLQMTGEGSQFARAVQEGVELTNRQFQEVLKRLGVVPIDSVGRTFDPSVHQAVEQVESADHDEHVIVEEFQRGYLFHDRVLRPAMVSVAIKKGTADTEVEKEGRTHG